MVCMETETHGERLVITSSASDLATMGSEVDTARCNILVLLKDAREFRACQERMELRFLCSKTVYDCIRWQVPLPRILAVFRFVYGGPKELASTSNYASNANTRIRIVAPEE